MQILSLLLKLSTVSIIKFICFFIIGCPLKQDIIDSSTANAYGEGLYSGEEERTCTFYVDTRGARGDLFVQVDGRFILR